ncbi:uncharacterized protein LOC111788494 [Cucurbita pepo subsp. pepo]|uniref:uncharacterized protein LOC111788494 n=1 Tax=Cucurbita pepo subsp. pepo TaxID=3664 RepID=UPI000C9D732F|nr:uncharacterized protein LOC111788494 [Cucurbita pepo subsp. pepo]
MAHFQSAHGGGRCVEIVSGKRYGGDGSCQIYGSPNLATSTNRVGSAAAAAKPWRFGDPEGKRRKRIAKYKVYTVEGKVKDSLRKGLQWIKTKCSRIVHGY